jgi:glycosyltransferase involved in cell wall biosynthesis
MTQPTASPLVSVCIFAYQHGPYIKECLDSVLNQETTFVVEILLADDNSTDGTRQICQEYAARFPERIRLILRSEEEKVIINGQKTGRFNIIQTLKDAKGKYLVWLDGDDYFCDIAKLQKQADFLEAHPDHAICFHRCLEKRSGTVAAHHFKAKKWQEPQSLTVLELARNEFFILTCGCMFRNHLQQGLPDWFWQLPYMDYALHVWNAQFGRIGYLPEAMAVYRIHANGMWSMKDWTFQHIRRIELLHQMLPHFSADIQTALLHNQRQLYKRLLPQLLQEGKEELFTTLFNRSKDYEGSFQALWVMDLIQQLNELSARTPSHRLKTLFRKVKKLALSSK